MLKSAGTFWMRAADMRQACSYLAKEIQKRVDAGDMVFGSRWQEGAEAEKRPLIPGMCAGFAERAGDQRPERCSKPAEQRGEIAIVGDDHADTRQRGEEIRIVLGGHRHDEARAGTTRRLDAIECRDRRRRDLGMAGDDVPLWTSCGCRGGQSAEFTQEQLDIPIYESIIILKHKKF